MRVALVKLIAIDRVDSELGFHFGDSLISGVLADLENTFGYRRATRLRGATFAVWTEELDAGAVIAKIDELLVPAKRLNDQKIVLRYGVGAAERDVVRRAARLCLFALRPRSRCALHSRQGAAQSPSKTCCQKTRH